MPKANLVTPNFKLNLMPLKDRLPDELDAIDAVSHRPSARRSLPDRLTVMAIFVVVLGIIFRFTNLQNMVYWGDEVYTSIRLFGYQTTQIVPAIAHGEVVQAGIMQRFLHLNQNLGMGATLRSLMLEDSHLTPLYFVLSRLWVNVWGDSIASIRGFAAFAGALLLPAVYWLSRELFARRQVALITLMLVALSPVQVVIAQDARMYSLWITLLVLSAAAMLRAIRHSTWGSWALYSLLLLAGLYTHFLTVFVAIGFSIYIWGAYRDVRSVWSKFLVSTIGSSALLTPWLWVFMTREKFVQEEVTNMPLSFRTALSNLFAGFRRLFFDFNASMSQSWFVTTMSLLLTSGCVMLTGLAIQRLIRQTPRRSWLLVLLWVIQIPLFLMPLTLRGVLPMRYWMTTYVGLQLAIGDYLATALWPTVKTARSRLRQRMAAFYLVLLLGLGVASCSQFVQAKSWWIKVFSDCNPQIAQLVNQSANPLIVSDTVGHRFSDHALSNILSLATMLKPDTNFQVTVAPNIPQIATGNQRGEYTDRYLLTPTAKLRSAAEAQSGRPLNPVMTMQSMYRGTKVCLWRMSD